jgi:hypothetical protein
MKQPPAVAKWLLGRFAPSLSDSLVGDLQEEYAAGRSAGWYWRQVLRAVMVSTSCQLYAHPWEMVRAIAVGWVFLWIFFWIFFEYLFPPLVSLDNWLFVRGIADIRAWWPDNTALLIYIVATLGCACAGWTVARFHRRQTVLLFVVTVLIWNLWDLIAAHLEVLTREAVVRAVLMNLIVMPISIVIGGLVGKAAHNVSPASNTSVP